MRHTRGFGQNLGGVIKLFLVCCNVEEPRSSRAVAWFSFEVVFAA